MRVIGKKKIWWLVYVLVMIQLSLVHDAQADETSTGKLSKSQQTAVKDVIERAEDLIAVNQSIWNYAEVGLQETKSSQLLIEKLKQDGFTVKSGVSDMPTAFVASYGSGKPVIGILAEYDALPGLSQKAIAYRESLTEGGAGHACGHSGLGTAALGAALAVKRAIEKHHLKGTIRLYGTPAEETGLGKVYMLLDGQFKDLDICLHWHPSSKTNVHLGSSKALVSVKFTFSGLPAHASVSPERGVSALDAVELMNTGVNFMREHVKEDARMHYVIIDGGGQPNVVPAKATVWYYVRANTHEDLERNYRWVIDIAKGAALMTRTKLKVQVDTDNHELIPNTPLSELIHKKLTAIGPPKFSDEEKVFARRIQQPLIEKFGQNFPMAIDNRIHTLLESRTSTKGSTDVGDISWHIPTGGLRTTCFAAGNPGHSWQNVACIGSSIGEKGILYAAQALAASTVELLENPALVKDAKADFDQRIKDRKYITLIPKGQKPPVKIR
ncbi:amidohydrolase [uncultured Gimesia sp.]|uniref:amidohydrolase n=1 Tax=uncultured Gimesia sp. TaxID=1678688 RepID=UPI002623B813|nr:amidohydrolase [uncultured Gimesia sp.]